MFKSSKHKIFVATVGCLSLGAATQVQAAIGWVGGNSGDPTSLSEPLNWGGGVLPGNADDSNFDLGGGTFSTVTTNTSDTITGRSFYFNNLSPLTYPGFTGWTVNGTGTLLIGKSSGSTGSQIGQILTDDEGTGLPTQITINSNVQFVGTGVGTINMASQTNGGNIEITTPLLGTGTGRLYMNTGGNSASTIKLSGGIDSTNTRSIQFTGTAGKTILGSSSYAGGLFFGAAGAGLELIHNNSLGADGSGLTQIGGGSTHTGSVLLTGGLTGVPEFFDVDQRLTTAAPHFTNESGTNVLSGETVGPVHQALELENGGNVGATFWTLQSNGVAGGDLLKVTGNVFTTSLEATTAVGSTLNLQGAGNGLISGNITEGTYLATVNTFGITKADGGTWTLSGTNTYSGPTTITGGKLVENGTHTGGGNYTIAAGATLAGTGTTTSTITGGTGTVAPGDVGTIGTLTVSALAAAAVNVGTIAIDFSTSAASTDLLADLGSIDFTGTTLTFNDLGAGTPTVPLVFATYAGGEANANLPTYTAPTGYSVLIGPTSASLVPLSAPEPASLGLLGMGALAMVRRRRAK